MKNTIIYNRVKEGNIIITGKARKHDSKIRLKHLILGFESFQFFSFFLFTFLLHLEVGHKRRNKHILLIVESDSLTQFFEHTILHHFHIMRGTCPRNLNTSDALLIIGLVREAIQTIDKKFLHIAISNSTNLGGIL